MQIRSVTFRISYFVFRVGIGANEQKNDLIIERVLYGFMLIGEISECEDEMRSFIGRKREGA